MHKRFFLSILVLTLIMFVVLYAGYLMLYYEPFIPKYTDSYFSVNGQVNSALRNSHKIHEEFIRGSLFFASLMTSALIIVVLENTTEWITPIEIVEWKLLRKNLWMRPMSGMGFGFAQTYQFWFENDVGEEVFLRGKEEHFYTMIEGNRLKLHIKKGEILTSEILSVD